MANSVLSIIKSYFKKPRFCEVCERGLVDEVKELLKNDIPLKHIYWGLMLACLVGHIKVVKFLLEIQKHVPSVPDTCNLLIEPFNSRDSSFGQLYSPLMAACHGGHSSIVDLLLEKGSDPTIGDHRGYTPLMVASEMGHIDIVRKLKSTCKLRNNQGFTALHYASSMGHVKVVSELLTYDADFKKSTNCFPTPLMAACMGGHNKVAKELLNHSISHVGQVDADGNSALLLACQRGQIKMIDLLIDAGARKQRNSNGDFPMMIACSKGYFDVFTLLTNREGIDVQERNHKGMTILMAACQKGNMKISRTILRKAQSLGPGYADLADRNGDTALIYACQNGHHNIVQMLLENDADENKWNNHRDTPLIISCLHGYEKVVKILLQYRAKVYLSNLDGMTPLMAAAKKGWFNIACLLLDEGASETTKDHNGDSAISMAKSNHMLHLLRNMEAIPVTVKYEEDFRVQPRKMSYLSDIPANYIIRCETEFCCVFLPKENNDNIQVEKIPDDMHPIMNKNEKLCTTAVMLSPHGLNFDINKPCVIVFRLEGLLEEDVQAGTFVPISRNFNEDNKTEWEPMDTNLSNYIVDYESISISAHHSGLFAVKYLENQKISEDYGHIEVPEGYIIQCETDFCCVLLPLHNKLNVQVNKILDNFYPDLNENEFVCADPVALTPEGLNFDPGHPCILVFPLNDKRRNKGQLQKFIPLYGNINGENSVLWRPLDPSMSNLTLSDKTVSFSVYSASFIAVKYSTTYPYSITQVNTNERLTISVPELNNFHFEIPENSLDLSENVTIKSTIYYCDHLYNASEICAAASSCVKFEPHGQKFKHPLQVVLPIPNYDEIIAEYPDIKLNVWCSQNLRKDEGMEIPRNWQQLQNPNIIIEDGTDFYGQKGKVAKFEIEHFSWYQCVFDKVKTAFKRKRFGAEYAYSQEFRKPKSLSMRMKAVMSQPVDRIFGIVIAFYRFGDPLMSVQKQYPYNLAYVEQLDLNEGNFKVCLKGNRFVSEDMLVEVERIGAVKLFEGENMCHRFEYILELKPTCSLPLRKSQILGSVKLKQKRMIEKHYTLMVESSSLSTQEKLYSTITRTDTQSEGTCEMVFSQPLKTGVDEILQQFNLELSALQHTPSEDQLRKISNLQGKDWEKCATALQLTVNEIDDIKTNYPSNIEEQRFRALLRWTRKYGYLATHAVLVNGFVSVDRIDLAQYVCKLLT